MITFSRPARATASPSARLGLSVASLPSAMTPGDLRQFTNGAADPIGDIETGLRQAAEQAEEINKEAARLARDKLLKTFVREAIKKNPMMGLPLILRGSSHQVLEEPASLDSADSLDSLRLERLK